MLYGGEEMSVWHISGGRRLSGSLAVQGAKNAVLPIMAASVLAPGQTELLNVPELRDVDTTVRILRALGCGVEREGDAVNIDSRGLARSEIPHSLMRELRSSVIFLGALLARCGSARLSMPGGCELGPRPIDLHLMALRALGARIDERGGDLVCTAPEGLHGADIALPTPSVGATENAMLCACAAEGETVIMNAAREPEIDRAAELPQKARRGGLRRRERHRHGARRPAQREARGAQDNARPHSFRYISRSLRRRGRRRGAQGSRTRSIFPRYCARFPSADVI